MAADERQRRREGSQRAQAARTRRQEARRKRQQRNLLVAIGSILLAVVLAGVLLFTQVLGGGDDPGIGYAVEELPGIHSPPYEYITQITVEGEQVTVPPTSGNHLGVTSPYGFLGTPLVVEQVVHNMEHSAVIIWYQPDDPALAGQVNQFVRTMGAQCIVAGTYEDMSVPVAATAWGRVLPLESFDEAQLRRFVSRYRGELGPEQGLCRSQS